MSSKVVETASDERLTSFPHRRGLYVLIVILLGLLAYANTLSVPFIYDDVDNISNNPIIKSTDVFFSSKASDYPMYRVLVRRYVAYLTFALNYRLGGLGVSGYHAVNIAIHLLNALVVYLLVILTFRTPFMRRSSLQTHAPYIALFASLAFVAHPIQTQAVTYTVQRMTSLATLFYLGALVGYIKCRLSERREIQGAFYVLALVFAVLGMKTKEITFTLPLAIALYEWFFFEGPFLKRLLRWLPLGLSMLIIPITQVILTGKGMGETAGVYDVNIPRLTYLMTEIRVLITYLRLTIFPVNQTLLYDYPIYESITPSVVLSFLALASLAGASVYLYKRSTKGEAGWRLVSFGIFWFFLALSVESTVVPLAVMNEHRMYLPSVGIFTGIATGGGMLWSLFRRGAARKIFLTALLASVILFTAASLVRNQVWTSPVSLWEDVVQKAPDSVRAHINLGSAYLHAGQKEKALDHLQYTSDRDAAGGKAEAIVSQIKMGDYFASQGSYNEAVKSYRNAITLTPGLDVPRLKLASLYLSLKRPDAAIQELKATLRYNPRSSEAQALLGQAYMQKGAYDSAMSHLNTAIQLAPETARPYYLLASAFEQSGKIGNAIEVLVNVLNRNPDDTDAIERLAALYQRSGQMQKSMELYSRAILADPGSARLRVNLGILYAVQRRFPEAIEYFNRALSLDPELPDAHFNLGLALKATGDTEGAIRHYQEALKVRPAYFQAAANLASAYHSSGNLTQAIEHYRQALAIGGADARQTSVVRFNLALAYEASGDRDRAIEQLKALLASDPGSAQAHSKLARLYAQKGMQKKSRFHADKARALSNSSN